MNAHHPIRTMVHEATDQTCRSSCLQNEMFIFDLEAFVERSF